MVQKGKEAEIHFQGRTYQIPVDEIQLLGLHNYFNIGVAYGVCRYFGMEDEVFTQGLKSYVPLPHRLQFLGEWEGVKYYDDSISTCLLYTSPQGLWTRCSP